MELIKAIILGIVQGATEFLPVSSSGHLVLGSHILGFQEQGIVFDVLLHLGTLVSVVAVFRQELSTMAKAPFLWMLNKLDDKGRHYLLWDLYVVVATIPAVFVGPFYKEQIEKMFTSVTVVCFMLIVTGLMMITAQFITDRSRPVNGARAFLMGCGQAFAIIPGVSRSGTTIFIGMLLGINRETAARFSFIMSIPAILGAAVLNFGKLLAHPPASGALLVYAAGTISAALTGYLAIILLLEVIRKNRLQWFGYYCLAVASVGLIVLYA
ncbi:MAG: undecaprenyl-diphosphate phosphatase [Desulfofustis sp.]|nr:undecaprenyl-diphosphate phosphatase [Desulfofustis sp.]